MRDDYEATFVLELPPLAVWESLTRRTRPGAADGQVHYVLPGFPSFPPLDVGGASCTLIESEPGRLLRVRKDDHPCQGTEIAVRLERVGDGTRITIVQSGFAPEFLELVGRDTVFEHGDQIVADFRLYLERGITVPGTSFGWMLGARTLQTPVGVAIDRVDRGGPAERAGLAPGDLLITVGGIRIHDLQQLWTVSALTAREATVPLSWVRGSERMSGKVEPGGAEG